MSKYSNKRKMIIAGDDEASLEILYSIFEVDFEVFRARNEKEAYEMFFQIRPSIIITNLKNNTNDWISLTRKIKMISPSTVLYSISEEKEVENKSIEAGADEVFNNLGRPLYDTVYQHFDNKAVEANITVQPTKILKYARDLKFEAVSINNNNADFELRNKSDNP